MGVDRGQLQAFIRDLGAIPPALQRELRPGMLRAGQPALREVQRRAGWSTRIPGATVLTSSTGSSPGVTVRVRSAQAPHARPYEHDGAAGTFRHPVYGNRHNWVPQEARLFFYSGVAAAADQVAEAVADIVTGVAEQHGF